MCPRDSFDTNSKIVKEQPESYTDSKDPYESPLIEERYEIINGIRYDLKPSPGLDHQLLVSKILNIIYDTCRPKGIVIVSPMDIYLDEDNILQPDVIFISNENMHIIHDQKIKGAPNLVVEILPPQSGKHDKIHKKEVYERFGVPEFWVVDPQHEIVDQFVLNREKYQLQGTFSEEHLLTSPNLDCIHIDLRALFQEKIQYRQ
ncbi:Uma2 family endonuclease [Geomicrobium halophilum]|uniref:Uma2 family endonuclease n=1 Tax=Geomicrobium halophilum TaxID=549000 RepID=A0A841PJ11_9BACL|nr:Uma2 family endonuclease [Geomicrobium halophilum]MBB6448719.1 Uma2 family endonuclease [Geomicrobium halophilum]